MNGIASDIVTVRTGNTNTARIGKGGYARSASSTNSAYNAALLAAAKFFRAPESHIILSYLGDNLGKVHFCAQKHTEPVVFLRIEFEDKRQDFTWWEIVRDTGHVVNCGPFQYTTWARCRVLDAGKLKVGDRPVIETPTEGRLTLSYAITKIVVKGGGA